MKPVLKAGAWYAGFGLLLFFVTILLFFLNSGMTGVTQTGGEWQQDSLQ
ncbi:MAG: hypothetical protein LBL24_11455 [Bacteroidales bacterium]|jgi:hypothetical protein|nr:hypothetical protein [Bacteroidales bacterium]